MPRNEEFETGRMSNEERAARGADRFRDAILRHQELAASKSHTHDYSDSKNNDTCSECGATNPDDSYTRGND